MCAGKRWVAGTTLEWQVWEVKIEEKDESWMNHEGIAIKTCHKFSKERERDKECQPCHQDLGLTSRKNEVMLFTRAATRVFPLQAMSGVLWVAEEAWAGLRSAAMF